MARRVIGSVLKLFSQVNQIAPNRSKASDGTFPSAQHSIDNPTSDHEPHLVPGVGTEICTAGDYTHDPARGADMAIMTEEIRASRDPRIKYVIFRDRMFSSYATSAYPAWTWRPYKGNYHGDHAHVSTLDAPIADTWTPWRITMALDLDQDPDFTALKWRVLGLESMTDPIDIHVPGATPEPNKLAQEIRGITSSFAAMSSILSIVNGKLDQIIALLKATPDPESPSAQTVAAGIQAWMVQAVEANTDPDDVSP